MSDFKEKKLTLVLSIVAWVLAAVGAFGYINYYSTRPGAVGSLPLANEIRSFVHGTEKSVVVAFIHPKCKCSDATVDELSDLMSTLPVEKKPKVLVLFYYPQEEAAKWATESALYKKVIARNDWQMTLDQGGKQAYAWGALTSGHIIYVDEQGEVQFSGGITESRGHRGENLGKIDLKKAILKLENENIVVEKSANENANAEVSQRAIAAEPTFGCAMHSGKEFEKLENNEKPKITKFSDLGVN